ncbi:hypothetical protein B0H16DRAFT_1555799 [Mycena metata]|uniref:Uncharacterized protein n=1 Tax=Mycena metata TaxID=1033252 RepID=A0AAD7N5I1_9AGAR|nr:hypothetical protein B0H16DRAFT_1555799 [Mycena metata]
MSWHIETIERLCHDKKTADEAKKLYQIARAHTAAGSGFDLGETRTGLPAVCALLASERLNNTNVTLEAARIAASQSKAKFIKLREHVEKALAAPKPALRKALDFKSLLLTHCTSTINQRAAKLMDEVEVVVLEKLEDAGDKYEKVSDDEITCAIFIWVCNVILQDRVFHNKSFEERYETDAANMRAFHGFVKACGRSMEAKIREDYAKIVADIPRVSPRKSPVKPLRTLPSGDSPQKRKVAFPGAAEDSNPPDSPTKRRKVTETAASSSLVTLESIHSMTSSPAKASPAPSTPRKARRLPSSPSRSPSKTVTPSRALKLSAMNVDDASSSSDEEDHEPPTRRRFRPVFRDQKQWAMCDPRLVKIAEAAAEFNKRMIQRHGVPFQDLRHDRDVAMDSD